MIMNKFFYKKSKINNLNILLNIQFKMIHALQQNLMELKKEKLYQYLYKQFSKINNEFKYRKIYINI